MRILILGGTSFAGRHITESALSRGHDVTLFNRNRTNATLFPQVEKISGDRDGGLEGLLGRTWDAVVDVNGYIPRLVADSANLLAKQVGHYLYVSTIGVFDIDNCPHEINELSKKVSIEGVSSENFMGEDHGALKLLCEEAATSVFTDSTTVLRPGYIAGPHDNTDRLSYWVDRFSKGGSVFIPHHPDDPFQITDARDLADFTILAVEQKIYGDFNITGPVDTWGKFVKSCEQTSQVKNNLIWVDDAGFIDAELGAPYRSFGAFPLRRVIPLAKNNASKAVAVGLTCRPISETVSDILTWQRTRKMSNREMPELNWEKIIKDDLLLSGENYWLAGITLEHEKEVLEKWKQRS